MTTIKEKILERLKKQQEEQKKKDQVQQPMQGSNSTPGPFQIRKPYFRTSATPIPGINIKP